MGLLVVGTLGLDDVSTPFDKIENALGGSATYIALSASYFSGPVYISGVVGKDFPKKYIDLLEQHNIDLEGLQILEGEKTFRSTLRPVYYCILGKVRKHLYLHIDKFIIVNLGR